MWDAKAVQLNGDVRLSTSPVKGLDGALRFHYSDYDNQTPERNFIGRVPYDVSFQRYIELRNHALDNTQWQAGLDLDYAVMPQVRIGGTYEFRARERTQREVEKDDETVFSGRARVRPLDGVEIDARYWHGDRKLDEFLNEDYIGLKTQFVTPYPGVFDSLGQIEQPDLRRFDVANRVQDRATAGISYALGERVDLSATYTYLKNDYRDSKLGLQEEEEHTVAGAGTVHVHERLDLSGGYGFGLGTAKQASRQSSGATLSTNPLDNWGADLEDTDVYVAAGFDWWARPEKLSLSANYQLSGHVEEFDLSNGTNTAVDLPDTEFRRHEVVVDAHYRWLKNTTIVGATGGRSTTSRISPRKTCRSSSRPRAQ